MRLATGRVGASTCLLRDDGEAWLNLSSTGALGQLRDVDGLLAGGAEALALARAATEGQRLRTADVVFHTPLVRPQKIICIGLNYAKHAAESGSPIPRRPIVFAKFANCLSGPGDPIVYPAITRKLDYEAELAVVIGKRARRVPEQVALDVVAGFAVANDVSARDLQKEDDGSQWVFGKALDGFCPLGPWLTTRDSVPSWRDLRMQAWVNGELRQDEICNDMIFGVEALIAHLSQGMTLEPGDIILTGTPAGVGLGFKPPRFLNPGDIVKVAIESLGHIENRVVAGQ